jgi:hypothetical protein
MQSIKRALPPTAALIGATLLLAACGGGASKTTTTDSAADQPQGSGIQDAYKYAACMRNHGLASFPDPQVTHANGGTQIAIRVPQAAGTSPQFKTAQAACNSILPAPSKSDLAAQAKQQEIHKQGLLAFAHCLRSHGINGFPDPTSQGQLSLTMVQAAGIDLTAPQFRTAALACVPVTNGVLTRASVLQATSGNPNQPSSGSSTSAQATPSP